MTDLLRQSRITQQSPWRSTLHALLNLVWNVAFVTFLTLYIVELTMPGYVSTHLNHYLVLIVGLIAFFLQEVTRNGPEEEMNIAGAPPRHFLKRAVIVCVGILGISAIIIQYWSIVQTLNRTQMLMTALFLFLVIAVVIAIMRDEEGTR